MTQETVSEKETPETTSEKEAEKAVSPPYGIYGEDFSVMRFLVLFGLASVVALVLYVPLYLNKWGWIGDGTSPGPDEVSKGTFYLISIIVALGVVYLGRLALRGIRQRYEPIE